MSGDEKAELVELLRCVFKWRPAERPSAQELLDMRWVKSWALPTYEASRGHGSKQPPVRYQEVTAGGIDLN